MCHILAHLALLDEREILIDNLWRYNMFVIVKAYIEYQGVY
jgi:hypothetical protein